MRKEVQKALEDYISYFGIQKAKEQLKSYKKHSEKYNKKGYVFFDENHFDKIIESNTQIDVYQVDYYYDVYKIPKKRGGYREIASPSLELKSIQEFINENVLAYGDVSNYCHGFVKGRSIVTNALNHCNKELVICMDIKDFFRSIKIEDIISVFSNMGYNKQISNALGMWCSFKGALVAGSPSSPALSNLVFSKLDEIINDISIKYKFIYSRYADDMVFSTNKKDANYNELIEEVEKCVKDFNFSINAEKTKIYPKGGKQEVTGLIVNNTVKVKSKIKKEVLTHIYYCQKFGFENHLSRCDKEYILKSSIEQIKIKRHFINYIKGKINFIKMVEPLNGGNIEKRYLEVFAEEEAKLQLEEKPIIIEFEELDDIYI